MTIAILAFTLVVVSGAVKRSIFSSASARPPRNRDKSDPGSAPTSTGFAKNAFASVQNALSAKTARHHASHLCTVRTGTPCTRRALPRPVIDVARAAALATITITAM